MEADIKGYVVGSGPDPRSPQDVAISAGATGLLNYSVFNPGIIPSLNTPYDLATTTLTFVITDATGATVYTATVAVNSPTTAGTGTISLAPSATSGLGPSSGFSPVVYSHVTTTQTGYQIYQPSRFTVGPSEGSPNPPTSPPGPQGPAGPAGTPPTYTRTTIDGTAIVLCSYTLFASSMLRIELLVNGKISPRQSDGGIGELGLVAYFESDVNGTVTQRGQDAQSSGTTSASFAALSPQPSLGTRIVGSRVDVLLIGSSTAIDWICTDTLTSPPPPGAGAGTVGPAGAAGPIGLPGTSKTWTAQTVDGTTPVLLASYVMGANAAQSIHLTRVQGVISPAQADGGLGELGIDAYFTSDAGGVISQRGIDEQSGNTISPSFPSTPTLTTQISGNTVNVFVTGAAATTINWSCTDTQSIPAPPAGQGPAGPTGATGATGSQGIQGATGGPLDLKVTTTDATPTVLGTYPLAASGLRVVELRIFGQLSPVPADGGAAELYLDAYFSKDAGGNGSLIFSSTQVVPLSPSWPAGTNATAQLSGGQVQVLVTGAIGSTIKWECVDWSTVPPVGSLATMAPSPPSYNADMVSRSGVVKWRQHERAKATFDGSSAVVAVTWPDFQSRAFECRAADPIVTDSQGPIEIEIINVTSTGCTVQASDVFAGEVDIDIAEVLS